MKHQKCFGEIFLEKREYKNAIEIYTNSVKYYPENYEIYYNLGVCYSMINDFAIARKCFQKTVEINDDMYLAYYRLGQIALLYREFDTAEINFSKSIYKEKEAKAYIELAKIHIMKNQKEKAILAVNNALKVESDCYGMIEQEPIFFSIKNLISKPEKESKIEILETKQEKQIDEYLKDTYNLTKILNSKKEIKQVITENKET